VRNPFSAFKDPMRRPRAIVWTGVVLVVFVLIYGASMAATSTTWFCNNMCHNVHADNAKQYFAGAHSEVSCIACHYPPSFDPARFALDRVDKLLDIYPTVTGTFEMPLNKYSRIGLEMPADQCTQCHSSNRRVSPTNGLKIDHAAHSAKKINCTICHNRVAHPEVFPLTLPGNAKHEDFMTMRACFRCHSQENTPRNGFTAPGTCPTCHTPDFKLEPASHTSSSTVWVNIDGATMSGHAAAAKADSSSVTAARTAWAPIAKAFVDEEPRIIMQFIDVDTEQPLDLPPVSTVSECGTCHTQKFCDDCHAKNGIAPK
jgi:Zn finger protein HypA/HybF involved in hydrogenase expression